MIFTEALSTRRKRLKPNEELPFRCPAVGCMTTGRDWTFAGGPPDIGMSGHELLLTWPYPARR